MDTQRKHALRREAEQHLRAGRIGPAIQAYEALLILDADDATAWYNLGYLHRCERNFSEAVGCYRKSLDHGVDAKEEVHLNLAVILSEHLNDYPAAEAELQAALDANPTFLPAWLNLGCLREDAGNLDEARQAYREVVRIEPGNGRGLARLAVLNMISDNDLTSIDTLQAHLARPETGLLDTLDMGFALGELLDSAERYDEAFSAYTKANEAARALSRHPAYDPDQSARLIDALIDVFKAREAPVAGPEDASPIFICGMFRSGSTLAEALLSRHSRVTAGGELEIVAGFAAQRLQPYPNSVADLNTRQVQQLRKEYLGEVSTLFPDWEHITDKRPDNFLHIGLIKKMFPEARIVHTVRNRMDNLLSIYFGNFDPGNSYSNDLVAIDHWQSQYDRLMSHWKTLYPESIFNLDYDRLVVDPAAVAKELCAFCELPWEDALLETSGERTVVKTLSNWQVRRPLHGKSSGRWKHYARHLETLTKPNSLE